MWTATAASGKTSLSLSRLSVVTEERSLHETAPNVVALLPVSTRSPSSTYVAVAAHPDSDGSSPAAGCRGAGGGGALEGADLLSLHKSTLQDLINNVKAPTLRAVNAVHRPVLQLCLYNLNLSYGTRSKDLAALAPDMMLIQTVDLTCEDLRLAPSQQAALKAEEKRESGSPAAVLSPEAVVVEQLAWVGVRFVALKTRQRQLLLVQTGLSTRIGDASADDVSSDEEEWAAAVDPPTASPVRRVFRYIADFCSATLSTPPQPSVETSVLIVAETQHVSAVVCETVSDTTARSPVSLREYTWKVGPFNHISAAPAPSARDPAALCLCGSAASNSIEVYKWSLNSVAPPVCVHHVLLTAGHFFYGASVTAHDGVPLQGRSIDFWVVGAAAVDLGHPSSTVAVNGGAMLPTLFESSPAPLPSLRGLDGHYFQVEPSAPAPQKEPRELPNLPMPSTEHRTLNSVWQGSPVPRGQRKSDGEPHDTQLSSPAGCAAASTTSLTQLEAMVSLRISAPHFLPPGSRRRSDGTAQSPAPSTVAMQRYLLHIHCPVHTCSEEKDATCCSETDPPTATSRPGWSSKLLSLDTAECAAALRWLAEDDDAAEQRRTEEDVPSWKLDPAASLVQFPSGSTNAATAALTHELTLHTARRVLKLSVDSFPSSASRRATGSFPRAVHVRGTHELLSPEQVVGWGAAPQVRGASPPLLLLSGYGHTMDDDSSGEGRQVTLYGQTRVKTTWTTITRIQASLLVSLSPWKSGKADAIEEGKTAQVDNEKLLASVRSMVAAEGSRLQRHFDERMDRLEAVLGRLTQRQST
ncbi:hypothetical protein ABB37_03496 [Leptomonas pyrrhocoris]|uniref:Uncharacterized protein n=1 Tax=Leptomonas pyrrhocoris TaxID=157538 RepID=A0A0M9G531_LEPPY|nr:hypothetical protein ABB37_03496 [Leptomonas pyrrhocoris]XP_015660865.1 hypothetical protein ABB37_03496 [Leptomonas pyrrhocoris]XP_015660866.1 hypothetical protein ABB37_03496 [Leptomonas pyrrhocoris]KPA82425.1 hypothetical protein ABB37_03496 [Leptomonas pyrrhocoris]KPA82426.1 hypothetical protein ABB37_03496 [Leptomonas pyrrhocoris]KPA82427.1 hypothetical protein ABB37_03496 [Leptomonas pyrrhocoris]|eukprot:XP_015660864.1 hypothetical protein ABB37_03496 [Leptomonas pyrrhocoris]